VQSLIPGLRNLEASRSNLGKDFGYTKVIRDLTQSLHANTNIIL
jgi:hypothetical protein